MQSWDEECHPIGKPEPITEGLTDQATGFKFEVPLCMVNMPDMVKTYTEDRIGVRLPWTAHLSKSLPNVTDTATEYTTSHPGPSLSRRPLYLRLASLNPAPSKT